MRMTIVYGIIALVWIILLTRVYYLSIKSNEYYEQIAEKNAVKTDYIAPVRGQILDKNGKPLAVNKLGFEISIKPHLRRNMSILDNEINFNVMTKKNDIEKVVNNTIYAGVVNTGNGSIAISDTTVIGGKDNQISISSDVRQQLNSIVGQIETLAQEIDDDRTDIADAIIEIKKELEAKSINAKPLRLAFYAIKGAISGLANSAIETLAEQAIKLLQ